ncbi:MAG: chemotaxis protein CheA, partial [Bdellovibrionaceae bacterium]|nr:chemotaxis protein CheA [Pseudobdellovibrionaceae bacterium]
ELRGEETELDKTILEKITDPLVHLVRNAVDHGIEKPEVRSAQGKNPTGLIILGAHHKSGRLIIEICDDGAGLNPETIRKKAVEKGLIGEQQKLTPQECYQLIFAPGFSTKEVVTDVSGRGVGMDVVRTNITELNGEISIESEVGKGATFRISLPLTLAIIDAMIVLSGPHKFVIPVNHVYETLRVDSKSVSQSSDLGDVLLLRGELVPIYRLADFFGIDSKPSEKEVSAIINRSGKRPFALVVDEIIGQSQVVIKQLSPELQGIKGVSGVTILGDGKPSLILEPPELVKRKLNKNKPLFMEVA